ncbi:hypothetical protein [Kitasatospora kifunensis]|uniref:Uncharacterized protein n=1 Tax=Kitasatospora kifunensis TaxID=58351 RepID=A0A7W7QY82_KITKI|nr:hypothetical protein [Kitasatospora kifunensis]MBB4921993.1 hypothetical protein [Kitasatospora kifunensis]
MSRGSRGLGGRLSVRALVGLGLVAALSNCGQSGTAKPKLTAAQARARNAAVAQEVIASLPVKPQTVQTLATSSSPCLVDPDAQPDGTVQYGTGYNLVGLTVDAQTLAAVRKELEAKHYRFVYASASTLQMHSPDNSTNVTMDRVADSAAPLNFTITSSCVRPDESPTPIPSPTRAEIP